MRFRASPDQAAGLADHVILFASYEQRCRVIARELAQHGYRGRVSILFCEDALSVEVEQTMRELTRLLPQGEQVPVSVSDPRPIVDFGARLKESGAVLLDVTSFTRGNLFALLWAWGLGIDREPDVTIGYCPAASYGNWLSREFERPHNIVGFGGSARFQTERNLICLVGFDGDRAWTLVDYLEPSRVILCLGTNPSRLEFVERNKAAVGFVTGQQGGEIIELPVGDPNATLLALERVVVGIGASDTVHIGPFNNKLSCLATYACWLEHRDIRIWNVVPRTYNFLGYSEGSGDHRLFSIEW
jgi:hypothetical protein